MKGLILAGGRGTRLRPLTDTRAKQLLPVANKPVLFYGLENLVRAGITDIGVVVGDTQSEMRAALGDGSRWGARLTFLPQEEPLGLAHAALTAEAYLENGPFVMYLGDNLLSEGLADFVGAWRQRPSDALLLMAPVSNPREYGVGEIVDDRVVRVEEKPAHPRSNLALTGIYAFGPHVFQAARAICPSHRGELEITDAIQHLIDHGGEVRAHVVRGWWIDTGRPEDMLEANRVLLGEMERAILGEVDGGSEIRGNVRLEAGARVVNSVVQGPAIIGRGCVIEDASVGPFASIGENAIVRAARVEHSIVLAGSSVSGEACVEWSLVGRDATLTAEAPGGRVLLS